ncbi:NAD-dependent epimerase/dehydratase family protein [Candidatus Omnitrophota bacterium]
MSSNGKKIVMTGSTGFIGTHLMSFLTQDGYDVFEASRNNGFDLAVPGWTKSLPHEKFDCVIHLAQSHAYRDFPDGALDMINVNVRSTVELLEWSRAHCVKRFIFASSGTVYEEMKQKICEKDPCVAHSMYAASKLSAECCIQQYAEFFEVVIMRLFGVYGPGQKDKVIPSIIERIASDETIELMGEKGLFLTPLFITDCVEVIAELLNAKLDENELIVNVAGDEIVSLDEIVSCVAKKMQHKEKVVNVPGEPVWVCGDNSLLRKWYTPKISFQQGLERVING